MDLFPSDTEIKTYPLDLLVFLSFTTLARITLPNTSKKSQYPPLHPKPDHNKLQPTSHNFHDNPKTMNLTNLLTDHLQTTPLNQANNLEINNPINLNAK